MYKALKKRILSVTNNGYANFFEISVSWPFVGNFTRCVLISRSEHRKTPDSERILKRNQDTILEKNGLQSLSVYYEEIVRSAGKLNYIFASSVQKWHMCHPKIKWC